MKGKIGGKVVLNNFNAATMAYRFQFIAGASSFYSIASTYFKMAAGSYNYYIVTY